MLFCLISECCSVFSQAVYEVSCKLTEANALVEYKGLLLSTGKGNGFIRLTRPGITGPATQYDLEWGPYWGDGEWRSDYAEQKFYYPYTKDSFLLCRARFIRTISGEGNSELISLSLWFRKNKTNGTYEPHTGNVPFTNDQTGQLDKTEFHAVMPLVHPSNNQGLFPEGEENCLHHYKKLPAGNLQKKILQQYFNWEELDKKSLLSADQLVRIRDQYKPTLYLISAYSGEKLCRDDAREVSEYFEELSRFMNIPIRKMVIKDNDFNVKYVTRTLQALTPRSNDIILFTYSGHGFSYMEDEQNQFPQLALWHGLSPKKEFIRVNTINLEEIYSMILAKNARLNIVTGDCCNSYIEMRRQHTVPTMPGVFGPRDKRWNHKMISDLFLETRQSYLLAAAKKGEVAASHEWYGGFFTFHFLETINEKFLDRQSRKPGWEEIIEKIRKEAFDLSQRYACREAVCGQHLISKTGR